MQGNAIEVRFNSSLLVGDSVVVQPYLKQTIQSKMQVLLNASLFCMQTAGGQCIDVSSHSAYSEALLIGCGGASMRVHQQGVVRPFSASSCFSKLAAVDGT